MAASKKKKPAPPPRRRLRRPLLAAIVVVGALWIAFFDSHSLARRVSWHYEHRQLEQENEALQREIAHLETRLADPVSDDVIEQIAREDYGMRRPGETVYRYRVEPAR